MPSAEKQSPVILDPHGIHFDAQTIEWLKGNSFSAAGRVSIGGWEAQLPSRVNYLCQIAAEKNVLHVGCCDHLPLVAEKIAKGQWLHGRISQAANSCLGVDLDAQAVAAIKADYGYSNLVAADLTKAAPAELSQKHWDVMLLGEILEHVDNPVDFLAALRATCGPHVAKLVLTVPNAFSSLIQKYAKRGFERINTDHRYWFSPYTLAKVLTRAGYTVESFRFVTYFPIRATNVFKSISLRLSPCYRDCLVMVARP